MTRSNILPALVDLRREYAEVINEAAVKREELTALESRQQLLADAIESLKRLSGPGDEDDVEAENQTEVETEARSQDVDEDDDDGVGDIVADDGPLVSVHSPIAEYIKGGPAGRRLRSTYMVRDVVEELDKVVTRAQVKDAFFHKFSRSEMQLFWDKPDNAFGTALMRAVQDKLIVRGERKSGTEVFGSLALAERLRLKDQQRKAEAEQKKAEQEKTASSETEAEEGF